MLHTTTQQRSQSKAVNLSLRFVMCLFVALVLAVTAQVVTSLSDSDIGIDCAYAADDSDFYLTDANGNEIGANQDTIILPGTSEMLRDTGIYVHVSDRNYVKWGDRIKTPSYNWNIRINSEIPPASEGTNEDGYIMEKTQTRTTDDPWDVFKVIIPSVQDGDQVTIGVLFQSTDIDETTDEQTNVTEVRRAEIIAIPAGAVVTDYVDEAMLPETIEDVVDAADVDAADNAADNNAANNEENGSSQQSDAASSDSDAAGNTGDANTNDENANSDDDNSGNVDNNSDENTDADNDESANNDNNANDEDADESNPWLMPIIIIVIVIILVLGGVYSYIHGRNQHK